MRRDGAVETLSSENGVGILGSDICGSCGSRREDELVGVQLKANSWEQGDIDVMKNIVNSPRLDPGVREGDRSWC